jgi:membrane protease YdiL (CAAX protease family)
MSIQNFDTWGAAASGFKYLPITIAASATSVGVAVLANWTNLETIKGLYFPENCGGIERLSPKLKAATFAQMLYSFVFQAPGSESMVMQGILQDGILTRAPRMFFNLCGKGHWADSKIAVVARTAVSAVAFSAMHLLNQVLLGNDAKMAFQLANTLGLGLVLAAIKEKTGSIWPAFGLHAAFNAVFMSVPYLYCATKSSKPEETVSLPTNGNCSAIDMLMLDRPQCHPDNRRFAAEAADLSERAERRRSWAKADEAAAAELLKKSESCYPESEK